MKTNKVKARAICSGIAKGDRKIKCHGQTIGTFDYIDKEQVTQEEINKCIETAKVWSKRFKNINQLKITLTNVEIDDGKDESGNVVGMASESYMMFSDKTINIEL